jgi:hypothetical protein
MAAFGMVTRTALKQNPAQMLEYLFPMRSSGDPRSRIIEGGMPKNVAGYGLPDSG